MSPANTYGTGVLFLRTGALKNQVQHFLEGMLHGETLQALSIKERARIQEKLGIGTELFTLGAFDFKQHHAALFTLGH